MEVIVGRLTEWILGEIPGSSPVTRGGITATRTGKNCWLLSKAEAMGRG
jgi:hypothetical protein